MPIPKIRLSLSPNKGKGRGKVQHAIIVPFTLDNIKRKCCNKFKTKNIGSIRLYVSSSSSKYFIQGTEITEDNVNKLENGMNLIVALKGEDYIQKDGSLSGVSLKSKLSSASNYNLPKPPKGYKIDNIINIYDKDNDNDNENDINIISQDQIESTIDNDNNISSISLNDIEFNGIFPILKGNVLHIIRECIKDSSIFIEKHGDGYIAFDYKSTFHMPSDCFLDPNKANKKSIDRVIRSIRRECRGLLLCSQTGNIIGRRFHKFFNLNEKDETKISDNIIPSNTLLMEKLDGSLVSPVILHSKIIWMSKTTIIDNVLDYINSLHKNIKYNEFSLYWLSKHYTPLFEWCDSSRIVGQISHSSSYLILLGIRHMYDGSYVKREDIEYSAKQYNIPIVNVYTLHDFGLNIDSCIGDISNYIYNQYNREGLVLCFPDGNMLKLKTLWYISLASASKSAGIKGKEYLIEILKRRPDLLGIPEYIIWSSCISDSCDDIISSCITLLENNNKFDQSNILSKFFKDFWISMKQLEDKWISWSKNINEIINSNKDNNKEIYKSALVIASSEYWPIKISSVFLKENYQQGTLELKQYINSFINKKYIYALNSILNLSWNLNNEETKLYNKILHLGNFDIPSIKLKEFVIDKYLPRKVCKYLGISLNDISDNTEIEIPSSYKGEEGKIKGYWEQFEKDGIIDLRVDIQPPLLSGFTDHFGDKEYCQWQIQYGASKVSKKSSKKKQGCEKSGAFASILIQTERIFTLKQMKEALNESFEYHCCVILGDMPDKNDPRILVNKDLYKEKKKDNIKESICIIPILNNNTQIYCDLDGVLANFDKGIQDLTGKLPSEMSIDYMWKRIITNGKFFSILEPYDGLTEFWEYICSIGNNNPIILTGLPNTKFAKKVRKHKQEWCLKYLSDNIKVITCMSKDKYKYCNESDILIDDRLSLKIPWESQKGYFIHHSNFKKTKWHLQRLIQGESWNKDIKEIVQSIIDKHKHINKDSMIKYTTENIIFVNNHENEDIFLSNINNTNIIAFDCEWRPDDLIDRTIIKKDKKSAISIIQFSTQENTSFIIDMINITQNTLQCIQKIFSNINILKIGYGIDEDIKRLNLSCNISPVLDLQSSFKYILPDKYNNIYNSISSIVPLILGKILNKTKVLQASDWEERPLSKAQLQYAASDSSVLLNIYNNFCSFDILKETLYGLQETIQSNKTKGFIHSSLYVQINKDNDNNNNNNKDIKLTNNEKNIQDNDINNLKGIKIRYSSILLDKQSKELILEKIPIKFEKIYLDHITLSYEPSWEHIKYLPVGKTISIKLSNTIYDDGKAQCVPIKISDKVLLESCIDNRILHLTLSTRKYIKPVHSNIVLQNQYSNFDKEQDFEISGIVSVVIECDSSIYTELCNLGLSLRIVNQIIEFLNTSQPGANLRFKPKELSASERFNLHEFAEKLGLQSRSEGKKDKRRLILTKGREEKNIDLSKTKRIISSYDDFKIIQDLLSQQTSKSFINEDCQGTISIEKISLYSKNNIPISKIEQYNILNNILQYNITNENNIVIIMRGLPGSGKSNCTKHILDLYKNNETLKLCKVSADDYFYNGAGTLSRKEMKKLTKQEIYERCFHVSRLSDAHNYCKNNFIEAINNNYNIIIVDNCNSRICDYKFYDLEAQKENYQVIIIEMICTKQSTVKIFQQRGLHKLKISDMMRIYSRWETSNTSILLDSFGDYINNNNNISCNTISLARWLSENHIIHYNKSRKSSHLSMAIGDKSVYFLDVPDSLYNEFLKHYINNLESGLYLMELCTPIINMFFDIDFQSNYILSKHQIIILGKILQKGMKKILETNINYNKNTSNIYDCIITGFIPNNDNNINNYKTGLHINFPNISVTLDTAIQSRNICIQLLCELCTFTSSTSWENTIDGGLYSIGRGMRMYGSRKVGNNKKDKGRVYSLISYINSKEEEDNNQISLLQSNIILLLKKITIRTSYNIIDQ